LESVRDVFVRHGIVLTPAYLPRVPGWATVRRALTRKGPDGTGGTPRLWIVDTPGNRWAIERLLEMAPDETNPDDVLKVDANEDGEGGDDVADCLRYGVATTGLPVAAKPSREKAEDRATPFDYTTGKFIRERERGPSRVVHRLPSRGSR
jgi:hypothetical protein